MHFYFTKCCVSFVPADSVILIFRQALLSASSILQCPKENSQDSLSLSLTYTHTHTLSLSHAHTHTLSHTHTFIVHRLAEKIAVQSDKFALHCTLAESAGNWAKVSPPRTKRKLSASHTIKPLHGERNHSQLNHFTYN